MLGTCKGSTTPLKLSKQEQYKQSRTKDQHISVMLLTDKHTSDDFPDVGVYIHEFRNYPFQLHVLNHVDAEVRTILPPHQLARLDYPFNIRSHIQDVGRNLYDFIMTLTHIYLSFFWVAMI